MKNLEIKNYEKKCIQDDRLDECSATLHYAYYDYNETMGDLKRTEDKICNIIKYKNNVKMTKELDKLIVKTSVIQKALECKKEGINNLRNEKEELVETPYYNLGQKSIFENAFDEDEYIDTGGNLAPIGAFIVFLGIIIFSGYTIIKCLFF